MRAPPWVTALALSVACVAAAVVLEWAPRGQNVAEPSGREPPNEQVTALLGGLSAGDHVGGWLVLGVRGPSEERILVDFARDTLRFSVTVARQGTITEGAPLETSSYGLYYGHARPPGAKIPDGAVRAILHDLARRLEAAERADVVVDGL